MSCYAFYRLAGLLLLAGLLRGQQIVTWQRKHNTFEVLLDAGALELELVSPSTFGVRRGPPAPPRRALTSEPVSCTATGSNLGLTLETRDLRIEIAQSSLISVFTASGLRLYAESFTRLAPERLQMEIQLAANERIYGLGPRAHAEADARGLRLQPQAPFYFSSRGYAFWASTPAAYVIDVAQTRSDRLRIEAAAMGRWEYFIAFGPALKDIWEERAKVFPLTDPPLENDLELLPASRLPKAAALLPPGDGLCHDARALVHASLSGVLVPAFDLGRYRDQDPETYRRAAWLGAHAPVFVDSAPPDAEPLQTIRLQAEKLRRRLIPFLLAYADETRTRGYPMLHPLLHQFPNDAEAWRSAGTYMLGDELLVVPACDGARGQAVYLPMGEWTDLESGQRYAGRRQASIAIPAQGVAVLARNGSILPLEGAELGAPMQLHYFPKLAGEFFLYEVNAGAYSQAHAAPAADIWRLEMESKVERRYEWVVHHIDRPKAVEQVGGPAYREAETSGPPAPGAWRWDGVRRRLHIGIQAAAGSDVIVNVYP